MNPRRGSGLTGESIATPRRHTMNALKGRKTRPPDPRDETTDGGW
jgi:hypothetical protein